MAAEVKILSDNELKKELMSHGLEVGPITDTTRALYIKKYNQLSIAPKNSSRRGRTKNVISSLGFSSDEGESVESGSPKSSKTASARRRKSSSRLSDRIKNVSGELSPDVSQKEEFKKPEPRRSMRKSIVNNLSDNVVRPSRKSSSPSVNRQSSTRKNNMNSTYEINVSDSDADLENNYNSSLPIYHAANNNKACKSYHSSNSSCNEAQNNIPSKYIHENDSPSFSPRTSTPTKPLCDLTSNNKYSPRIVNSPISNSTGLNGHRYYTPDVRGHFNANDSESSAPNNYSHWVSTLLLVVAVLFFIAIGIVYVVGLKQWNLSLLFSTKSVAVTSSADYKNIKGICDDASCVKPYDAEMILSVCNTLYDELSYKAGMFDCREASVKNRNMSRNEAIKMIESLDIDKKLYSDLMILNDALILFMKNSDWGIRLTNEENDRRLYYPEEVKWLESTRPVKTLKCRLIEASCFVASRFILISLLIALAYVAYFSFVRYKKRQERHKRLVYQLVEEIIGVLKHYHEVCTSTSNQEPYIPIPHVRDMILPPEQRKQKNALWEEAVKFIEDYESRVRVEYQQVAGEDYKVWRWLQSSSQSMSKNKAWQGRAFENDTSGINVLPNTPTSCLKIRNMFTPDREADGFETSVMDAVLEKCGENNQIVHIAIANDSTVPEGCVYVKCRTAEAAGGAYKALHGCWFDGKLVTVKFIRLERYHEHYPQARVSDDQLEPSNNLKLSLSQQNSFVCSDVLERS